MQNKSLSPVWHLLSQFKAYYPVIFIYSICISILTLATPIAVQSLVSTFSFGPYFQPIFILSFILLILLTVLGVLKTLQFLVVEYLQRKIYAKVTVVISQSYQFREQQKIYPIDSKANRYFDVVLVYKNLAILVTEGVSMALQTTIGLLLISLYHPFFIVFGMIIVVAIVGPVYLLGRQALQSAVDESTSKFSVADHIEKLASQRESEDSTAIADHTSDYFIADFIKKRSAHFRTVFMQYIVYIGSYAGLNATLLALGGYLVINNQLSLGQLVAAEIVVNAILSQFLYSGKYLESFYDMYAAIHKIEPFIHHLDEIAKKQGLNKPDIGSTQTFYRNLFQQFKSVAKIYSPRNYKKLSILFLGSLMALIFVFMIVPWQQFSRANGKVVAFNPNDRIQKITAPVEGIVEEWLVQDGQPVKKGEPIVRVVDNDPDYLIRLEAKRDAAVYRFEAAKEASDTARLNYHRQEKLVKEGLSSQKEFEQAKIRYKKLSAEEAAAVAELAKAETDLSRQQQQEVVAPRNGRILRILLGSGTTNVKEGQELIEFVPDSDDNAVELFVDGNDLPLVFEGRKVRLQFEGWPAVQFSGWPSVAIGSFGGIVSMVDPSVATDGTFRVLVKPDPSDPVNWPDQSILRQGARVMGIINLDVVTIGYELWRQINGFPKSIQGSPGNYSLEGKK